MKRLLVFVLTVVLAVSACSPQAAATAPTAAPPTATAIPTPTLTPTPVTPLTILLTPADYPADLSARYQNLVYEMAQEAGMRFQVRNHLSLEEARNEPGLQVVIAVTPDDSLAETAAALPQVRFLAIGNPNLQPQANLFTLGAAERLDLAGFMAGYITALITTDYRVGLILPKDDEGAQLALDAFRNGRTYFCGLCQAAIPPWYEYPVYVEIPADAPETQYPAYVEALLDYQVGAVFVHPAVATPGLLATLNEYEVAIVGTFTPDEEYRAAWVASIQPDVFASLAQGWEELLSDTEGYALPSPIRLTDVNEAWLSEGRQQLVEKVFADLREGYIAPLYQPEE